MVRRRDSRSLSPLPTNSLPSSLRFVGSSTSQSNDNSTSQNNDNLDAGRNKDSGDHDDNPDGMEVDEQRATDFLPNFNQGSPSDDANQNRFQTAQSGIPSTNLPMAPAARSQWNQLADIFQLDSKHRAEALRISSITGSENQYHALVCLLQKTRQDMDQVVSQIRSAAGWKPAADLGIIRETLRDHTIESYTLKVDSKKKPIARSFDKIAMEAIMKQTDSWKSENLPSDFGTSLTDLKQHEAFMKFFGAKVRHVRDDFRVALLTNILVPQAKLAHFFNPQDLRTESERIEAVKYHYASQEERKARPGQSHWAWVDQQLTKLRATDQGFFDGKKTIDEIKADEQFRVPTDTDISQAIDFMSSNTN
ncbi:hypothetical protein DFH28DRAFT_1127336 [Melampsora americana]|nr:hypothetical protein DFH28DRAFT_1127336 [Melampsora americana]